MHIFGCKFSLKTEAGDTVPDRKNFDSLLWAIVTVFQVISKPLVFESAASGDRKLRVTGSRVKIFNHAHLGIYCGITLFRLLDNRLRFPKTLLCVDLSRIEDLQVPM